MIYTVTFSPSLDYTIELTDLEVGRVNRASGTAIYPGGKGINVSIVLSALGVPNRMLGFVAGFTGRELVGLLEKDGHDYDFIELKTGNSRINVKLCAQTTTDINAKGPGIMNEDLEKLYSKLDKLTDGDVLVLAGSIPDELPAYSYQLIMQRLEGRGVKVIVDAVGEVLTSTLSYHPFLVKPNRAELSELFSTEIRYRSDIEKYARTLIEMGAQNVIVSLDSEGALLVTGEGETVYVDAPEGEALNSVGAGDSMIAGFICGLMRERDMVKALKMGVAAGSASAFSHGLPGASDIEMLYKLIR